jgi:uncharacterized Zn-finger protein
MAQIDLHTVDTLQLYAPRASKVDRKTVKGKILGGEVFSRFNQSERAAIWKKIWIDEACDGIIPSLHTFFRDISYLELCANAVKRLVLLNKHQPTVRSALVYSFRSRRSEGPCLIQTSETSFRRHFGSNDERISSGYRQIWMYAMRHYPDMVKDVQSGRKANPTRAKARAKADEGVIHGMATLAKKLGFRNSQIKLILRQSPDQQIARAALLKARKPGYFHYDSETFQSLIEQIAGCFALAIPNETAPVAHITGRAIKLKDRCGAPQEQTQQLDHPHIFLDTLHSATVPQRNLSSLGVRRSVYYAFFGKPSPTTLQSPPSEQSSANESLSPVFIPNDDPRLQNDSMYENTSRSSFDERSLDGGQDRSGSPTEQHQRQEDCWRPRQERQHAEEDSPFLTQDISMQSSRGDRSTISEVRDTYGNSSGTEHQPQSEIAEQHLAADEGMGSDNEERECTEVDEDDLLSRADYGRPEVEGTAAAPHSTFEAPNGTDIPSIPEEETDAVDVDVAMDSSVQGQSESGEDRAETPTTSSRQSSVKPPASQRKSIETTWKPYDVAQKSNRKTIKRSFAAQNQSIAQASMTNSVPNADQQVGFGPLQPVAEQEIARLVDQPDAPDHTSRNTLPDKTPEEMAGEQMTQSMKLTARADGDLLEFDREARERAEALAQLQTPQTIKEQPPRPVTELPADLPSLITRLREEGSQLSDESVIPGNNGTQGILESGRAIADDLDSDGHGATTGAVETRHPQQGAGRYTTVLPNPEQAQQEAIERQEAEGDLFDVDVPEELADEAVEQDSGRPTSQTPALVGTKRTHPIERQEEGDGLFDVDVREESATQAVEENSGRPTSETPTLDGTKRIHQDHLIDAPREQKVIVKFYVYEQQKWRKIKIVSASPDQPAEAQIIADQYAQDPDKMARFYDGRLRKVAASECVRAAIDDKSFVVFMSFKKELAVTRLLEVSAQDLVRTVRTIHHPEKRLKANNGASSAAPVQ